MTVFWSKKSYMKQWYFMWWPLNFISQYFSKNKYSRVVLFIFVNFDTFTNKTVEWPKFALFYKSFWTVLDRELATGLTPVTNRKIDKGRKSCSQKMDHWTENANFSRKMERGTSTPALLGRQTKVGSSRTRLDVEEKPRLQSQTEPVFVNLWRSWLVKRLQLRALECGRGCHCCRTLITGQEEWMAVKARVCH